MVTKWRSVSTWRGQLLARATWKIANKGHAHKRLLHSQIKQEIIGISRFIEVSVAPPLGHHLQHESVITIPRLTTFRKGWAQLRNLDPPPPRPCSVTWWLDLFLNSLRITLSTCFYAVITPDGPWRGHDDVNLPSGLVLLPTFPARASRLLSLVFYSAAWSACDGTASCRSSLPTSVPVARSLPPVALSPTVLSLLLQHLTIGCNFSNSTFHVDPRKFFFCVAPSIKYTPQL